MYELDFKKMFPATQGLAFLNTGSFGPQLQTAIDKYKKLLQEDLEVGRLAPLHDARYFADLSKLRSQMAKLLNADAKHIALMPSTTEGLNLALASIDWKMGDQIVTSDLEHPGALNPIQACAKRFGIEVKKAEIGLGDRHRDLDQLSGVLTERTRAVVLSHVSWSTGAILDIEGFGKILRDHERAFRSRIDFLVDGAQSVGAMAVDLSKTEADFYCFPGQKWLCGPAGTGGMFVSERILQSRKPSIVSYIYDAKRISADTFEVPGVSWNRPALLSLSHTLEWIEMQVGWSQVYQKINELSARLQMKLRKLPELEVLTPELTHAGLVHFRHRNVQANEITKILMQNKIYIRDIPVNQFNRAATGFYNTDEDLESLASALEKAARTGI